MSHNLDVSDGISEDEDVDSTKNQREADLLQELQEKEEKINQLEGQLKQVMENVEFTAREYEHFVKELIGENFRFQLDSITGFANRLLGGKVLRREISEAERYDRPLSVIMMDIDHFKKINDTYGHLAGDEILRSAAAIIRENLREKVDLPVRYGGEEALIILPETSLENARDLAERLRKTLKEHVFKWENKSIKITLSFGVTEFEKGDTKRGFVGRADQALYFSKKNGRNQVTTSDAIEREKVLVTLDHVREKMSEVLILSPKKDADSTD